MGKHGAKQRAAVRRETIKSSRPVAVMLPMDPSVVHDPNYVPAPDVNDSDNEGPSHPVVPPKRKREADPDQDLHPDRSSKDARTTLWRDETGGTKNGVAVFIFDCSSAHEAYSSDALLAHKMNRSPGGKQPKMRDTIVPATGQPQSMNFPDNYDGVDSDGKSLARCPKGMEEVLAERGLLAGLEAKHGKGRKVLGVCATCKLSQAAREKAMKAAKSKEDEANTGVGEIGARGVSEMEDVDLARFREYADGTFAGAKKLVPECLAAVTTDNIRHYFRHCYRYMDAYRMGLNLRQAAYAVKKYTSHRRIPANILGDVNVIARGDVGKSDGSNPTQ
ncbi:hypothetical protein C8R46DRAFT_1029220 [Mycena filopes]|nr:hypothetical protein C8R46DRAFT_1029220 [Mycena filopes]